MVISNIRYNHLKVSDLASWDWCNEESYLRCNGVFREETKLDRNGKAVHSVIVREPKFPWEIDFFEKLQKFKPIFREIDDVRIYASWDAIDPSDLKNRVVRVVENKTRGSFDVPDYIVPSAKFQLEIYAWIYKPIIERMGYLFPENHFLYYVHRESLELIKKIECVMNYKDIEEKIMDRVKNIKENKNIVGAKLKEPWKCDICNNAFKSKCRFWN